MRRFDIVIVGSGPAAVGSLWGLQSGPISLRNVAILTGEAPAYGGSEVSLSKIHSKVRNSIFESSMNDAICNFIPMASSGKPYFLFETACRAGLSAFWGQQFTRVSRQDFSSPSAEYAYEDYEPVFEDIERRLGVETVEALTRSELPGGLDMVMKPPSLVKPLNAFALEFELASVEATVIARRLARIERIDQEFRLVCEDGEEIVCGRVILASGLLGTMRILMNSVPGVRYARFLDHMPHLFHTVSVRNRRPRRARRQFVNMNIAAIEVARAGRVLAFLSIYDIQQMPANLVLAQFGLPMQRLMQGRHLSFLPIPYYPIQIWTKDGFVEIQLERTGTDTSCTEFRIQRDDDGLKIAKTAIRSFGFIEVHRSSTPPGFGFHYHALRLSSDGLDYKSAQELAASQFGSNVVIVDGSVMPRLSPRPHTETLVANAFIAARAVQAG